MERLINLFVFVLTFVFFSLLYFNNQNSIAREIVDDQMQFEKQAKAMDIQLKRMKYISLTVTAYSPKKSETDSTPLVTAFQKPVKYGIIGISRDLEKLYGWKEGDEILLEGIGIFEVGDRMHHRWRKRVDIFHWNTKDAINFGMVKTKGYKVNYSEI